MPEKTLYTVVVADDEDELREAVCTMIPWETLGFRLVGNADNGLDALELVEQLEPDLLLTDIRMPFISGIELARQVREIRPAMNIAFLSGYDDFEYAKQAIQYNIISYMLKPLTLDGLAQELAHIHEKIDAQFRLFQEQVRGQTGKESFLTPLLLDDRPRPLREEQLRQTAQECGLLAGADDAPHFVVMVSWFAATGGTPQGAAGVRTVEMLAQKYLRHFSFYSCGKIITLLLGNPSDFEEYLHILADELTQVARRVLGCSCMVGISRETAALAGLHNAYNEAVTAAQAVENGENREGGVRFIADHRPETEFSAQGNALLERLEEAFRTGSRAGVDAALDAMIDTSHQLQNGKAWLDALAMQVATNAYRAVYDAGTDALAELQARGGMPELDFSRSGSAEIKKTLESFCFSAMDVFSGQQKKGGSLICEKALETINEQYMDETLSLVSLSALLNVSPNHLSACIKKYAGESFINVLIKKRMEKARELLLSTPLKIQEIAVRCGYTDQHYFSYCFKKYCGASPNALRHENEKGSAQ